MQLVLRELRAAWAFVERNFNLTKRYWKWEVVFLAYTVANSVTMAFIYFRGNWKTKRVSHIV